MTAKSFINDYIGTEPKIKGVPGYEMNAPFVAPNTLAEIGIEIEVEGRNLPNQGYVEGIVGDKSKAIWHVKTDGSLRNGGLEYVLSRPCFSEEVPSLLGGLEEAFEKRKAAVQLSNRCSTHVHINQGGRKINHITSILALWYAFEEVLINYCGEERKTNHFCLGAKDSLSVIDSWNTGLKLGNIWRLFGDGFKYTSLNLLPLRTFGSLEFRTMRATEKPTQLLNWVLFINGLCKYAVDNYSNPQLFAADMSERGGREIFIDICRQNNVESFIEEVFDIPDNHDFERLVLEGFRRVQPIVMGHPWYDWMELIEKTHIPKPFKQKKSDTAALDFLRRPEEIIRAARIRPAVRPIPVELPVYEINWSLPIEFTDGTPAEVSPGTHPDQRAANVRAAPGHTHPNQRVGRGFWSYDQRTGWYSGNHPDTAQIRNVGALPVTIRDLDEAWPPMAPEPMPEEDDF